MSIADFSDIKPVSNHIKNDSVFKGGKFIHGKSSSISILMPYLPGLKSGYMFFVQYNVYTML